MIRLAISPRQELRVAIPRNMTEGENESNGLYFYRARYYSPVLGRFINEDPLGFAGSGPNFYAYVFDNPTNLTDPFGLAVPALLPALGGAAGAGRGFDAYSGRRRYSSD